MGALLERAELQRLVKTYQHELVKKKCIEVIDEERKRLLSGTEEPSPDEILIDRVIHTVEKFADVRLRRVINGTGILLHTGLGRSPLIDAAYQRAFDRVRRCCNLELDLESGKRGDRQTVLEDLIAYITNAEAAIVVNNNAAAVLLALNSLAYRKETLVSRGELIEIGGSFRLPEIMKKSGTLLVEVGTTNKTYVRDYAEAITDRTRAILVAHSSNYRIKGFVQEAGLEGLVELGRKAVISVIHDLGGGVIVDLENWNLPHEPVVSDSVSAGVDVVTFSGDKVLGGPQSGIIVGKAKTLERLRKNHLLRALRPDKFTLAFLEETVRAYLSPMKLLEQHPVLSRLVEERAESLARAQRLFDLVDDNVSDAVKVEVISSSAQLGSGALPLEEFPSAAIRLKIRDLKASRLAAALRDAVLPIIGYTKKDWVVIDVKAIMDDEIAETANSFNLVVQKYS
ncbi:L-seryl-tRNA(Sec) selenium transferase [bacterium]|nr:L-seryl-tRNA(Sec) selenium transferase [bacterium]MBU1651273.1 L-seryl-tRNA(Sec) selenium transferase [bacterium]